MSAGPVPVSPVCGRCPDPAAWQLCPSRIGAGTGVVEWGCTAHAVAMLVERPGLTLVPLEAALRWVDRVPVAS